MNAVPPVESKAQRFTRLGEKRMTNAVRYIRRLSPLSNTATYEWSEDQLDAMFEALDHEVAKIKSAFANAHKPNGKDVTFRF